MCTLCSDIQTFLIFLEILIGLMETICNSHFTSIARQWERERKVMKNECFEGAKKTQTTHKHIKYLFRWLLALSVNLSIFKIYDSMNFRFSTEFISWASSHMFYGVAWHGMMCMQARFQLCCIKCKQIALWIPSTTSYLWQYLLIIHR